MKRKFILEKSVMILEKKEKGPEINDKMIN